MIELDDSMFDRSTVAVKADGIVLADERVPNLEEAGPQQVGRHVRVEEEFVLKFPLDGRPCIREEGHPTAVKRGKGIIRHEVVKRRGKGRQR